MSETIYPSRRSSVFGRGGMVASSQPLATAAGLEILAKGGNAADAAVAAAAALNVTEPTSTGLGGDMFALFYDAAAGQVSALNGSGRAPAALTLDLVQKTVGAGLVPAQGRPQGSPLQELSPYHPYTATVPGACAGWCDLLARHGTLDLSAILAPAIRLADEGFPVAPVTSHFWRRGAERQLKESMNGVEMTIDGRGPNPGEIFRNPGLARTLAKVAEGGKQAFYEGEIAEAIVSTLREAGGCMTAADLAAHTSTWDEPISTTYGGLRLWECPPNGQGIAALIALNLLEGFDLPPDPLSADRLHLEIEAMRLAFADTRWYVADPNYQPCEGSEPLQGYAWLLSKSYAAERRKLLDPKKAAINQQRGSPVAGSDTVYFCVVDKWGNACSFINSNYMGFGTGIVPKGWGFTLQNRGHNFSLDPEHPNALAPGKRPYHTIIPAMITRDQRIENREQGNGELFSIHHSLFSAFGVMGGFMQPQGHLQVFLALSQGLDPQSALDMPRFCISDGTARGEVSLEEGLPAETIAELTRRGHTVQVVSGWERALFGRGQVILRNPETGILTGGSDPRADGCAMALS
ncbi:MAG: gamma-glutamyltranspeptidase [Anaerolineaceae bacterium]|nr:MAG: gamma-glutamyltranspeptidase [Anaerolineaceae bacterium]